MRVAQNIYQGGVLWSEAFPFCSELFRFESFLWARSAAAETGSGDKPGSRRTAHLVPRRIRWGRRGWQPPTEFFGRVRLPLGSHRPNFSVGSDSPWAATDRILPTARSHAEAHQRKMDQGDVSRSARHRR